MLKSVNACEQAWRRCATKAAALRHTPHGRSCSKSLRRLMPVRSRTRVISINARSSSGEPRSSRSCMQSPSTRRSLLFNEKMKNPKSDESVNLKSEIRNVKLDELDYSQTAVQFDISDLRFTDSSDFEISVSRAHEYPQN